MARFGKGMTHRIAELVRKHTRISAGAALALAMVGALLWAARGAGLEASHLAALIVSTVALAGLSVWIAAWE